MRTTRSDLDRGRETQSSEGHAADQRCLGLQGGASVGTPWLLEEDMERRSPLSEYMFLYPSLTHHRNINPYENKV